MISRGFSARQMTMNFEAFRRVGIPIADYDEFKAYLKGDEDEKEI